MMVVTTSWTMEAVGAKSAEALESSTCAVASVARAAKRKDERMIAVLEDFFLLV